MKIIADVPLKELDLWGTDLINYLTNQEIDTIDEILNEEYPDGITENELNDLFRFSPEYIVSLIGYESYNRFLEERE